MSMKLETILCLALVLSGSFVVCSAFAAAQEPAPVLRVVIKPSKSDVRVKETFKVALRVENPTASNQTVRVMNCSWDEEWQSSNTNVSWIGWGCTKNFAVAVEIAPGGAYTNLLTMVVMNPTPATEPGFRMGFTPIGGKTLYW